MRDYWNSDEREVSDFKENQDSILELFIAPPLLNEV